MSQDNLSTQISSQFPEQVGFQNPTLVAFMEAYYEYLSLRQSAGGLVKFHSKDIDIDDTLDEYVEHFYKTYAEYLPTNPAYDKRKLIKKLRDLYALKGTEKGTKLLFRVLFNQDADVLFPQDQILRASHSKWLQESSFRIKMSVGATDFFRSERVLSWTNSSGSYSVRTNRFTVLDENQRIVEVFFTNRSRLVMNPGDVVETRDDSGALQLLAEVLPTANKISIVSPGKNYRTGQVFQIPGTISNTLFRVVDTGPNGELARIQLISFGYVQPESQTVNISPFRTAPATSSVTVTTVGSTTFIDVEDFLNGVFDSGNTSGGAGFGTPNSYFLNDYLIEPPYYFGGVLNEFNTFVPVEEGVDLAGITYEEYLASVATVRTSSTAISTYPGIYETNQGNISDSDIKIQDSFYYQIFSYVINSNVPIASYRNIVRDILNPAGHIFFSNLNLDNYIDLRNVVGVFVNKMLRLEFNDGVGIFDSVNKYSILEKLDTVTPLDLTTKTFIRATEEDAATITDVTTKIISLLQSDLTLVEDEHTKTITLAKVENQEATDTLAFAQDYTVDNTYFAEQYVGEANVTDITIIKTP